MTKKIKFVFLIKYSTDTNKGGRDMAEVIILQMSDICISLVSHAPFSFTINTIKYKIQTLSL